MKAIELQSNFGIHNLKLVERPSLALGPGQIRLRMLAASLNYRDLMMVTGTYNPKQLLPLVPCSDGVGQVVEVGAGVAWPSVGDRVCTLFAQGWQGGQPSRDRVRNTLGGPLSGTLAEEMVLDSSGVAPAPRHLSDEQAASLPCAALTAWTALRLDTSLAPGSWVLTQGSGGVSIFALQLAKAMGLRVVSTSSQPNKRERLSELGADATVSYIDEPRWGRLARSIAGGEGVDHVVEVGGAGTLAESLEAVKLGGTISVIGVLSGHVQPLDLRPILMRQVKLQGVFVGNRDGFLALSQAIETHKITPVVDSVYPLEDAPAAFEHLRSGSHFGKICIRIAS